MEQQDFLNEMEQEKLPSGLNVLTILTFIGSGFVIVFSAITPWFMKLMKDITEKATSGDGGAQLTPKQIEDMRKSSDMFELVSKYFSITIPVAIICAIACIIGAVMMRRRKKDGFIVYSIAEILPVIVSIILMGMAQFNGVFSIILALGLPVLFIALYAVQRKHLTK